jgi:molybdate transport system regulatory protein
MKELLAEGLSPRVRGHLWIECEDGRFLGPGRVELLEKISEHGSISKAAAAMGMSYKKAWDLVDSMNAQARQPVVRTQAGGKQGGGATLTAEGEQLIAAYRELHRRFQAFLEQESARL